MYSFLVETLDKKRFQLYTNCRTGQSDKGSRSFIDYTMFTVRLFDGLRGLR